MQIENVTSIIATTSPTGTLAATTQITTNGKAQAAVVERTSGGYEAYLPGQIGPIASGSSIEIAESRLSSTVQFQA
jgi:hypothetical protein